MYAEIIIRRDDGTVIHSLAANIRVSTRYSFAANGGIKDGELILDGYEFKPITSLLTPPRAAPGTGSDDPP